MNHSRLLIQEVPDGHRVACSCGWERTCSTPLRARRAHDDHAGLAEARTALEGSTEG